MILCFLSSLDSVLDGGLYTGQVTEIAGDIAVGKTQVCGIFLFHCFKPGPAEPGYVLPLQTVLIQIIWLLKKPTDLDLHCLLLGI